MNAARSASPSTGKATSPHRASSTTTSNGSSTGAKPPDAAMTHTWPPADPHGARRSYRARRRAVSRMRATSARLEAIDETVQFVGLRRSPDSEASCLTFEESAFLGFDDGGIACRSWRRPVAVLVRGGLQLRRTAHAVGVRDVRDHVEDLVRRDLGAVLDRRQVRVGDPGVWPADAGRTRGRYAEP